MKYFIDTEFIEGFHKQKSRQRHHVDLISIGIVCEDGREFHKISSEYYYKDANDWVKENVLTPLYVQTVHGDNRNRWSADNFQKCYGDRIFQIRKDLISFFEIGQPCSIEIYGYFSDYDWVVFCSIFGTMMDLPKGFPMYCIDLKQMMVERGLTKEWKRENCPDPEGEHNALVDARWNKNLYEKIMATSPSPLEAQTAEYWKKRCEAAENLIAVMDVPKNRPESINHHFTLFGDRNEDWQKSKHK